jgi:hypothetical protein
MRRENHDEEERTSTRHARIDGGLDERRATEKRAFEPASDQRSPGRETEPALERRRHALASTSLRYAERAALPVQSPGRNA